MIFLELLLNGESIGSVILSDGLYASCPADTRYIYRVFGDEYIGVMILENDRFVLKKPGIFSDSRFEILRSLPGEEPAFPLPFALSHGEALKDTLPDALLSECLSYQNDVFSAFFRGERFVYFPFSGKSTSLAPFFFCLTVFPVNGKEYAAFKLKDGKIAPI